MMTSTNAAGQVAAGIWLRVSSSGQDEASQLPDCLKWCADRDYQVARTYEVHGESAFHGEQDADWQRVIRDVEDGTITVIVIWKVDRLDRRNIMHAVPMVNAAIKAGARIEFATQPYIDLTTMSGRMAFANLCEMAHEESKIKSDRTKAKHNALRASGSVIGRAPWGYEIVREDNRKVFKPTTDGATYVPLIFQRVIAGESLRTVAKWLDSEGVATMNGGKWNERFIGHCLIKNPVYYGQRRNNGTLETPALVTPTTWQAANAALAARVRTGRSTTVQPKALLAPVCGNCYGEIRDGKEGRRDGCPSGISPMYRLSNRDGVFYRCTGHGPQRKGCGAMVSVAEFDAKVRQVIAGITMKHIDRVFVPGDDNSDAIAKLREDGAAAMRQGDYQAATDAMQQAAALENAPHRKARWDTQVTAQSEADYFASLACDAQREYLARWGIFPVALPGRKFAYVLEMPYQRYDAKTGEFIGDALGNSKAAVDPGLVAKLAKLRKAS